MGDFVAAALPWVVMALALAIMVVKHFDTAARVANGEAKPKTFSFLGMLIGAPVGVLVGFFAGNVSIWIAPMMMVGLALGACVEAPGDQS